MAYIQTSRLPAATTAPVNPKPAASAAPAPAPFAAAAVLDLSAAAKNLLGADTSNVPWGSAPVKN